jgi:hypothetical protein
MVGPEGIGAIKLAEEIGVHQTTLSRWLREASGEEKKALEPQHTQLEPDQEGGPEPKSDAARPNWIRFFRATTTLTFSVAEDRLATHDNEFLVERDGARSTDDMLKFRPFHRRRISPSFPRR